MTIDKLSNEPFKRALFSIKSKLLAWKHRRVMRSIRGHFAFFGCPIDDMSDAEIIDVVIRCGKVMAKGGISLAEITENLRKGVIE